MGSARFCRRVTALTMRLELKIARMVGAVLNGRPVWKSSINTALSRGPLSHSHTWLTSTMSTKAVPFCGSCVTMCGNCDVRMKSWRMEEDMAPDDEPDADRNVTELTTISIMI